MILSHFQTHPLLTARKMGKTRIPSSVDLGCSSANALIEPDGVIFPGKGTLPWELIKKIDKSKRGCFFIQNGEAEKIERFSQTSNRYYSLMPTRGAPTMLISGVLMHRVKGIDPMEDTMEKIKTIRPIRGRVLDTATGLGYTAIGASIAADEVVTMEIDRSARQIARLNPWSKALFDAPNITRLTGDSFDLVRQFEDQSFTRIIHDPPTIALAGGLYSDSFYENLYRLLKKNGILFHYIGNPSSRSVKTVTKGVRKRLGRIGFKQIKHRINAFGLTAVK